MENALILILSIFLVILTYIGIARPLLEWYENQPISKKEFNKLNFKKKALAENYLRNHHEPLTRVELAVLWSNYKKEQKNQKIKKTLRYIYLIIA